MLGAAVPAAGQEERAPLSIGDDAPVVDVATWVRGEPVTGFEPGRVYVLDFWATRDRQSRNRFSALSDLQQRFRDRGVTVVGITHEEPGVVGEFLGAVDEQGAPWGERVRYALAADPDASVHRDYLAAAGAAAPAVFVIGRDAKIEWIGPVVYGGAVVDAVVDGRWDRETFEAVLVLRRDVNRTLRQGRVREGLEILDRLIAMDLARSDRHRLRKFTVLLRTVNDPEAAYAIGRRLVRDKWDDANALNEIAWFVADERGITTRDLAFAMETAKRANDLTEGKSPYILDTVARVYWEQGDVGTAIAWQYKAVQQAVGTPWERPLRRTLEAYERIAPAY
jgi:alkyl hydroperoxide reductase subunit AhpC